MIDNQEVSEQKSATNNQLVYILTSNITNKQIYSSWGGSKDAPDGGYWQTLLTLNSDIVKKYQKMILTTFYRDGHNSIAEVSADTPEFGEEYFTSRGFYVYESAFYGKLYIPANVSLERANFLYLQAAEHG